ncbi:methyltransferase domain-containing protein [Ensifer sp. B1-9]|uniref:methyltransferase domain-containing protein n=1 Tax=Ensifer sp. B1-9 TaxID=3141455 RepID=UPI003D1FEC5E
MIEKATTKQLKVETRKFRNDAIRMATKWDREWCEYFQEPYAHKFFIHMRGGDRNLWIDRDELRRYSPRDFYFASAFGEYAFETWTAGADIVDKHILEVGCGPGAFGKAAAKIASFYTGIDYSPLALHVAKIVSPDNTAYLQLTNIDGIRKLESSIDTVVSRHFFIHQNAENVRWLLQLFYFALNANGKAVLDFWLHPPEDNSHRATIRDGMGEISEEQASCVYYFSAESIASLVAEAGFEIVADDVVHEVDRRFVSIQKPSTNRNP